MGKCEPEFTHAAAGSRTLLSDSNQIALESIWPAFGQLRSVVKHPLPRAELCNSILSGSFCKKCITGLARIQALLVASASGCPRPLA